MFGLNKYPNSAAVCFSAKISTRGRGLGLKIMNQSSVDNGLFPHLATTKNAGRLRGWVSEALDETWLPRPLLVSPFLNENALKLQ